MVGQVIDLAQQLGGLSTAGDLVSISAHGLVDRPGIAAYNTDLLV